MLMSNRFLEQCTPRGAQLLHRADWLGDHQRDDRDQRALAWGKAIDYAWAHQDWVAYVPAIYYGMSTMHQQGGKYLKRMLDRKSVV